MTPDPTIWRTPNLACPACESHRVHQAGERAFYHPFSGHGFDRGHWSNPMLDPLEPLNVIGTPDPEENHD